MSMGVHIFYKLIDQNDNSIRYAYSGGWFSDPDDLVKAYDGILVISKESLPRDVNFCMYGKDSYQEKGCSATDYSNNVQIKNEDGTIVDLFALKVITKVFRIYKETGLIEEKNSIVY
ncbi:MAG: hypothetical protein RR891_01535 [Clostridium sp.]|uniref:hypothetical protein n=1 Tax=Clostridium sp. TaxID=1506 RepID=UPI003039C8DB